MVPAPGWRRQYLRLSLFNSPIQAKLQLDNLLQWGVWEQRNPADGENPNNTENKALAAFACATVHCGDTRILCLEVFTQTLNDYLRNGDVKTLSLFFEE